MHFTPLKPAHTAANLDQYYTRRRVARRCWTVLKKTAHAHHIDLAESLILEPSAGAGAFVDTAPRGAQLLAWDIDPPAHCRHIRQQDYLADPFPRLRGNYLCAPRVVVGNPPFGRKATTALAFIARSWTHAKADLVAFILPVQFRKWSAQRRVDATARLIADIDLPPDAFEFQGKRYAVRCCFQIWARESVPVNPRYPDLRLKKSPPVAHPDFSAGQFNRMPGSDKLFEKKWDFAIPRQGFANYSIKPYKAEECSRRQQWMLIKAHSRAARAILRRIDYDTLALQNTTVPGFGKADLVVAYAAAKARRRHGAGHSRLRAPSNRKTHRAPARSVRAAHQ